MHIELLESVTLYALKFLVALVLAYGVFCVVGELVRRFVEFFKKIIQNTIYKTNRKGG